MFVYVYVNAVCCYDDLYVFIQSTMVVDIRLEYGMVSVLIQQFYENVMMDGEDDALCLCLYMYDVH